MQYHIAVVRHDEGVAVHAEFVRQRELADVVDRHVRAGHAEQIRRTCLIVAVALAIEHGRAHGSEQSVLLPGGGVQNGRVFLDILVFVQLRR